MAQRNKIYQALDKKKILVIRINLKLVLVLSWYLLTSGKT